MTNEHKFYILQKLKTEDLGEVTSILVELVHKMGLSESGDSKNTLIACQFLFQLAASKQSHSK